MYSTKKIIYIDEDKNKHELLLPIILGKPCTIHNIDKGRTIKSPTCTGVGKRIYSCLACGDAYKEEIPALGHDIGEWKLDETTGAERAVCSICGEHIERLPPLIYNLLDDGTYSVKAGDGLSGVVEIPSTHNGKAVTQIEEDGFREQTDIITVIIPDSVTSIGGFAFYNCPNLVDMVIPVSVTNIGNLIISNIDSSFTTVYYGGTESEWANITIGDSNYALNDAAKYYYSEDIPEYEGNHWYYKDGIITEWDIFSFIFTLLDDGTYSVKRGEPLQEYMIPSHHKGVAVTKIEPYGFAQDYWLNTVSIPEGIKEIGRSAFWYSEMLTGEILIPSSVTKIGVNAFAQCEGIRYVTFAEGGEYKTIESDAFHWCRGIEELYITANVRSIAETAFNECTGLKYIIVAEDNPNYHSENNCLVETATNKVIASCKNSTIPSNTTAIGGGAFYGNTYFAPIKIPLAATRIEHLAFGGYDETTTVYVEASSKPEGWADDWCDDTVEVVWGYTDCYYGHTWGEWQETKPATCTTPGEAQRICSVCGEIETKIINETGHNIVNGGCTKCDYTNKRVIYYGVSSMPNVYDSSFISRLEHQVISKSHLNSIKIRPLKDEYIYYCSPTSFGDCTFAYNNFVGGFTLIDEIEIMNVNGEMESYRIYKSNQANLGVNGAITIKIEGTG